MQTKTQKLQEMTQLQQKVLVAKGGNTSGNTVDRYEFFDTVLNDATDWTNFDTTRSVQVFGNVVGKPAYLTNWNESGRVSSNLKVLIMGVGFEFIHKSVYTQAEYQQFLVWAQHTLVTFQVFNTYATIQMPLSGFLNLHNTPIVNNPAGDGTVNINDSASSGYYKIAQKVQDSIELPENASFTFKIDSQPIHADVKDKFALRALLDTVRITA